MRVRGYELRYDYEWVVTTAPINQYTNSRHLFVIDAATAAAVAVFDLYYLVSIMIKISETETNQEIIHRRKHMSINIMNANLIRYDTIR